MKTRPLVGRLRLLIFVSLFSGHLLPASEVFFREIYEPPKTINDEPQSYVQVIIDKERYQCAPLSDWVLMSNLYGWDFGAVSRTHSGYVAVKVETVLDETGAPVQKLTQELIDEKLKSLKPDGPRYEGKPPPVPENATEYNCEFMRIEGVAVSKCHYRFLLMDRHLITFACDSTPDDFNDCINVFGILAASFSKAGS